MTPGITCRKCHGRIDEMAFINKCRVSVRLGKEYEPPKLCTECAFVALMQFAEAEDEPGEDGAA